MVTRPNFRCLTGRVQSATVSQNRGSVQNTEIKSLFPVASINGFVLSYSNQRIDTVEEDHGSGPMPRHRRWNLWLRRDVRA